MLGRCQTGSVCICRLLPPTPSQRDRAAVATQFLTVTLPSAANQLPAPPGPSFQTPSPPLRSPAPQNDPRNSGFSPNWSNSSILMVNMFPHKIFFFK